MRPTTISIERLNPGWQSRGSPLDPTIQIRDPNDTLIIDGVTDNDWTCNDSCSFTMNLTLGMTGTYTLLIFDKFTNETGGYEIGLQCLIGSCADAVAMCGDNCIDHANGPLIPDDGGNVQRDTNGDGYGNRCDADLNNDGVVNPQDLGILRTLFLKEPGPACTMP